VFALDPDLQSVRVRPCHSNVIVKGAIMPFGLPADFILVVIAPMIGCDAFLGSPSVDGVPH